VLINPRRAAQLMRLLPAMKVNDPCVTEPLVFNVTGEFIV